MRYYLRSGLVRAGLAILVLGSAPLVVTLLLAKLGLTADPDPNPLIFGILAMLTFWPSIIMIVVGVMMVRRAFALAAMGRTDVRVPLPDGVHVEPGVRSTPREHDRR
jgi:hypothetical protein